MSCESCGGHCDRPIVVPRAVLDYLEDHEDEIVAKAVAALSTLDGSRMARVSMLSGLSPADIEDVGGL